LTRQRIDIGRAIAVVVCAMRPCTCGLLAAARIAVRRALNGGRTGRRPDQVGRSGACRRWYGAVRLGCRATGILAILREE